MEKINNCGRKFTPCFLIPQRYLLSMMTSVAVFVSYTMRANMSIAITEMVVKANQSNLTETGDTCKEGDVGEYVTVEDPNILYHWDEETQSHILGSFYWSYLISHLPGAILAEKVGGKHILGLPILFTALLTIIQSPIVISTNGSWEILVILRVLMGFGQGVVYPVCTAMLAQWSPPKEKGLHSSICYSGALLGTVVCNLGVGALIRHFKHWSLAFYFFGGLSIIWCVAWQLICYSYPRTHPCLKDKEKAFLEEELGGDVSKTHLKMPWFQVAKSLPVWALIVCQWGHDWGWFTLSLYLPKYMSRVLKFNVQEVGMASSLPFFFMWIVSMFIGYVADWIVQKKYLSLRWTRIIFGTLGQAVPGVFMVLAVYTGCDGAWVVVMFTISLFFMGFYFAGVKVNALDLSPNFAGTIMAVANGLGVIAGIIAPLITGRIVEDNTLVEWKIVFWIAFVVLTVTNIFYVIFLSTDVQAWNYAKEEENKDN